MKRDRYDDYPIHHSRGPPLGGSGRGGRDRGRDPRLDSDYRGPRPRDYDPRPPRYPRRDSEERFHRGGRRRESPLASDRGRHGPPPPGVTYCLLCGEGYRRSEKVPHFLSCHKEEIDSFMFRLVARDVHVRFPPWSERRDRNAPTPDVSRLQLRVRDCEIEMEAFQKKISWRDLAFREGIISDAQRRTQKSQFSAQLVARREEQQKCEEALRDLEVQSQNIEKEEARIEERKKTHPIYQPNFPKEKIVDLFLSYRLSGSKMSMFDGMFDDEAKGSSSATKSVAAPEEPQPLDVTAAKNEQLDSATEASQSLLDSNFAALVDSGETDEVLEQYKAIVAEAEAKIRALQQTNTGDEETANKAKENDAEENDTELMSH